MSIIPKQNSPFILFENLLPSSEMQKIKAQIFVLWKSFKSTGNSIEMVLVDEEGTRIHATIEDDMLKKHHNDLKYLKQGNLVTFKAFQLKDNCGEYRTSPFPYKILVIRTTAIKPLDESPKPFPEKYFTDFQDIKGGNLNRDVLIDVIAQILNVAPIETITTKGKKTTSTKVEVLLRDALDVRLSCTLWGEYGKKAIDYTKENNKEIVVCILRFVYIKEYKGTFSLSNVFNATQIEFNPQCEKAKKFRFMLPSDNQLVTHNDNKSQWSLRSPINYMTEFFETNVRMAIKGITESIQVGTCVTCVTIESIDVAKNWYYYACKCNKKVQEYGEDSDDLDAKPLYNCENCGDIHDVITKYYLVLIVSDESKAQGKILFFNDEATQLLKKPAAELAMEGIEDATSSLPTSLTNLIGKKILVKITIGAENQKRTNSPYVVSLLWDNEDMIKKFEERPILQQPLMLTSGEENSESWSLTSTTPTSKRNGKAMSESSVEDKGSVTKKLCIKGD